MVQIYGIPNCDSVKKAIKYLKAHNIEYEFIDFKLNPVGLDRVNEWLEMSDIKSLFNARSTTYRNLKLKELNLNDVQKSEYLAKENMLIKRPVITFDNSIIVGYNELEYLEKLIK